MVTECEQNYCCVNTRQSFFKKCLRGLSPIRKQQFLYTMIGAKYCALSLVQLSLTSGSCEEAVSHLWREWACTGEPRNAG